MRKILLVTLVALVSMWAVLGHSIMGHVGSNFFSTTSEDLLKDVYLTTYHVRYDTSLLHCDAMLYPYGEYYIYTGNQTLVSTPLWLLTQLGVHDAYRYVLPIINLLILASVLLCVLFLYLTFTLWGMPFIVSLLASLFITFLSPQLHRIGGHLTLSYICVIPMMIYLTAKHYYSHKAKYSVWFGILLLLSGIAHPYYLPFFGAQAVVYHCYLWLYGKKNNISFRDTLMSFLYALVVPLLIFFFVTTIGDTPSDRTSIPSGFVTWRARLRGLVYPYGMSYARSLSVLQEHPCEWESWSYVGVVGIVTLIALAIRFIVKVAKRQWSAVLQPTDKMPLNITILSATLLYILATLLPLIVMNHQRLLTFLGPLTQLRAMGRLLWLPYYACTILAAYWFYLLISKIKARWLKITICTVTLLLCSVEVYAFTKSFHKWFRAPYEEWTDYDNRLPQNQWFKAVNANDYQAILSLPVFFIGSDQGWIAPKDNIFKHSALVSIKTGIPIICNCGSRSSIRHSYEDIELSWLPWKEYDIMSHFCNDKPLLIVASPDTLSLNHNEQRLLRHSTLVTRCNGFDLYRIELSAMRAACAECQTELECRYHNACGTDKCYIFYSYDDSPNGCLTVDFSQGVFFNDTIPTTLGKDIEVSFWVNEFTYDLYGRSTVSIEYLTPQGVAGWLLKQPIADNAIALDGENGLVALSVEIPSDAIGLRIRLDNEYLTDSIHIRNLLIRPSSKDVGIEHHGTKFLNNIPILSPSDTKSL